MGMGDDMGMGGMDMESMDGMAMDGMDDREVGREMDGMGTALDWQMREIKPTSRDMRPFRLRMRPLSQDGFSQEVEQVSQVMNGQHGTYEVRKKMTRCKDGRCDTQVLET